MNFIKNQSLLAVALLTVSVLFNTGAMAATNPGGSLQTAAQVVAGVGSGGPSATLAVNSSPCQAYDNAVAAYNTKNGELYTKYTTEYFAEENKVKSKNGSGFNKINRAWADFVTYLSTHYHLAPPDSPTQVGSIDYQLAKRIKLRIEEELKHLKPNLERLKTRCEAAKRCADLKLVSEKKIVDPKIAVLEKELYWMNSDLEWFKGMCVVQSCWVEHQAKLKIKRAAIATKTSELNKLRNNTLADIIAEWKLLGCDSIFGAYPVVSGKAQ